MGETNEIVWLVIDEDRFSRGYLRSNLTRGPHVRVLEAESGLRGMEILSDTSVDGVILDVLLSDFDGFAVLDLLERHPLSARAYVAIASKLATQEAVMKARQLGVHDYLVKPFKPSETERRLRQLAEIVERRRRLKPDADASQSKRILVADDANFSSFSKTALAGKYDVKAVSSLLEILVQVNNWSPDLLLLNSRLRGMDLTLLQQQLVKLPPSRGLQIHLLGAEPDAHKAVNADFSGWLPRTFVPDEFCSGIAAILEPGLLNRRTALAWLRNFSPEMISAVRQVLGMMTHLEALPLETSQPPPHDLLGSLCLRSKTNALGMLLELRCQKDLATKLAVRLTGLEQSDIDEELQASGITEVLNVVGGRLLECCRGQNLHLKIGLPKVGPEPTPSEAPLFRWDKSFQWGENDVFQIALHCYENWGELPQN